MPGVDDGPVPVSMTCVVALSMAKTGAVAERVSHKPIGVSDLFTRVHVRESQIPVDDPMMRHRARVCLR